MKKILLFIFIVASCKFFAQLTPCTALAITSSSTGCTMATITNPATNNTWSVDGGGVTGLVTTCQSQATAGAGNYWLSFTAPASTTSGFIDVASSGGGGTPLATPEYQVYTQTGGTCPGSLSLSYLGCGGSTAGSFAMVAGTTYYIRVYDDNADKDLNGEKFDYCVRTCTSNNDACECATAMTPGTPVVGSNATSTLDDPFTGGGWCPDGNVWYKFTTPASPGCYSFANQQATAGCNYVTVYPSSCPSQGSAFLNNNTSTNVYNDQGSSEPGFGGMLPNTTYFVSVANTVAGGTFTLNVKPNTPIASNDLCSSPIAIGTTSVLTDNAVAGCEYSYVAAQDANVAPATLCASSLENISWFSFTAVATGTVTIKFSTILCNNGGGGIQTGLITGTCASYTIGTSGSAICAAASSGTITYNITNATAGQTYLIGVDGNAGSNCHFFVSGTNVVPLPIELIMFKAELNGNSVDINWSTATETNNDYFTIERSADGINFEPIDVVKGAGNSLDKKYYYLQDKNPIIGVSYYRLKQTDFDKKASYSVIQSISIDKKDKFDFVLYPNPSDKNDDVRLQFFGKENEVMNVLVMDLTGKILSEKEIKLNASAMEVNLSHHFDSGIYFVKVSNKKGESINQKFIVK